MLSQGQMFDHFRIMRLLGRGGMGEVYLARDTRLARKVALKVIHPNRLRSAHSRERFLKEAQTTARFNHPHIITIYAVGTYEGLPYVALEYLEGETLHARMREEQLSLGTIFRLGLAIARALEEAHRHNIVHQDLKPSNIFLPKDGQLRVLDFGLAQAFWGEAAVEEASEEAIQEPRNFAVSSDAIDSIASIESIASMTVRRGKPEDGLERAISFRPPMVLGVDASDSIAASGESTESAESIEAALSMHEDRPLTRTEAGERKSPQLEQVRAPGAVAICGTPAYMAPEQWEGSPGDGRADVWAFGVLMYELVLGRRPYPRQANELLRHQVLSEEPVPGLATLQARLPEYFASLFARCLQKEPSARPTATVLVRALLEHVEGAGASPLTMEESPFRGLRPFQEQHAHLFFGREGEIASFLELLRDAPVLPVVGPSGAGKSSFLQAGIVPRLREQGDWSILSLRPGRRPFNRVAQLLLWGEQPGQTLSTTSHQLSAPGSGAVAVHEASSPTNEEVEALAQVLRDEPKALSRELRAVAARVGGSVLLLVDQLEELLALVDERAERRAFLEAICSAADDRQDPIRVVFSIRDDFLGRLDHVPALRDAMRQVTVLWRPHREALQASLCRPLVPRGYHFDDETLIDDILDEVEGEPAGLPLLQFTARMLWERRDTEAKALRRSDYEAIGGLGGALATHAKRVFDGLNPTQRRACRTILLRLVTPHETRATQTKEGLLEGQSPLAGEVLKRLVDARLLTVHQDKQSQKTSYELAHESMIHRWDQLALWLEEGKEERQFSIELEQAAALWVQRGAREEEVWQGEALQQALRQRERLQIVGSAVASRFLEAGTTRAQRGEKRRQLVIAGGLLTAFAVALVSLLVAFAFSRQTSLAQDQRHNARMRLADALLAGAMNAQKDDQPHLARVKLRSALELRDSLQARLLWWKLTHQALWWRQGFLGAVYTMVFSQDSRFLGVASQDRAVHLVDIHHNVLRAGALHRDRVRTLAIAPHGDWMASGGADGQILFSRIPSATKSYKILLPPPLQLPHKVLALALSPHPNALAAAGETKDVQLWKYRPRGHPKWKRTLLRGHSQRIRSLAYSRDGRWLASGSYDGSVRIWSTEQARVVRVLRGHTRSIVHVAFAPRGALVASSSRDRTIRLWDLDTGTCLQVLRGHQGTVRGISFHPKGRWLASSSNDRHFRIWDLHTGESRKFGGKQTVNTSHALFSPDGKWLAVSSWDGSVRLWKVSLLLAEKPKQSIYSPANGVAVSPDGRTIATGHWDRNVRLWDRKTGRVLDVLTGHRSGVRHVLFGPNGKWLASSSWDKTVRIWNVRTRKLHKVLVGHKAAVQGISFHPKGHELASVGDDKQLLLWRIPEGTLKARRTGHSSQVEGVAFSADGKWLASGGGGAELLLWSGPQKAQVRALKGHSKDVRCVAFHPRLPLLASGGNERKVRLWNLATQESTILGDHPHQPLSLSFSPTGRYLVVGGSNGHTRIWDWSAKTFQRVDSGPKDINALAFGPDERWFATVGDDHALRLWDTKTGRPLWRTLMVQERPKPALFTQRGWVPLGRKKQTSTKRGGRVTVTPPRSLGTRWERALWLVGKRAIALKGRRLCVATYEQSVELWDLAGDRRLGRYEVGKVSHLQAKGNQCLFVARHRAYLMDRTGTLHLLYPKYGSLPHVTALWVHNARLYVASGPAILELSAAGAVLTRFLAPKKIDHFVRVGRRWIIGQAHNGLLRSIPVQTSLPKRGEKAPKPAFSFSYNVAGQLRLLRLLKPPFLVSGHGNGQAIVWNAEMATGILERKLHGAVFDAWQDGATVHVVSEIGDVGRWDTGWMDVGYCSLLAEVWQQVPGIWVGQAVRLNLPPPNHRCARHKRRAIRK